MQFRLQWPQAETFDQRRDMLVTIPSSSRLVVADPCHSNELTISHPAVAEHEREAISERTKRAKRGRQGAERAWVPQTYWRRKSGFAARTANATQFAANVLPIIREVQAADH